MSHKLTLSISDKELIEEAKKYAKANNQSLSRMIESYLKTLVSRKKRRESKELEISPEVRSLLGFVKTDRKVDYKKEKLERLEKKYLNG